MNDEIRIKTNAETRRKLKLLAALMGKTMQEVLDLLVDEALKKAQANDRPESLEVSDLSES